MNPAIGINVPGLTLMLVISGAKFKMFYFFPILQTDQTTQQRANRRVERLDAVGYSHLSHIWSQRCESPAHAFRVICFEACTLILDLQAYFISLSLSVHSSVHACAGAGGSVPFSNWLWTLFVFLAQRRLWLV